MKSQGLDFELQSVEGLPIRGVLHCPASARALIISIHGFKGFKDWSFFPWTSEQLVAQRFASCRFNMSRSGVQDSTDVFDRLDLFADDTYSGQLADLRSVVTYLQSLPELKELPVFLFGHSRGGAIALLAAPEIANLAGVVTWAAIANTDRWTPEEIADWRATGRFEIVNQRTGQVMTVSTKILDDLDAHREQLDVLARVREIAAPILVVHGNRDESVSPEDAWKIAAAAPDASLMVIENATHTFGAIHPLIHIPRELEVAMTVTLRFIDAYA